MDPAFFTEKKSTEVVWTTCIKTIIWARPRALQVMLQGTS